jgi:hypothetical protein
VLGLVLQYRYFYHFYSKVIMIESRTLDDNTDNSNPSLHKVKELFKLILDKFLQGDYVEFWSVLQDYCSQDFQMKTNSFLEFPLTTDIMGFFVFLIILQEIYPDMTLTILEQRTASFKTPTSTSNVSSSSSSSYPSSSSSSFPSANSSSSSSSSNLSATAVSATTSSFSPFPTPFGSFFPFHLVPIYQSSRHPTSEMKTIEFVLKLAGTKVSPERLQSLMTNLFMSAQNIPFTIDNIGILVNFLLFERRNTLFPLTFDRSTTQQNYTQTMRYENQVILMEISLDIEEFHPLFSPPNLDTVTTPSGCTTDEGRTTNPPSNIHSTTNSNKYTNNSNSSSNDSGGMVGGVNQSVNNSVVVAGVGSGGMSDEDTGYILRKWNMEILAMNTVTTLAIT